MGSSLQNRSSPFNEVVSSGLPPMNPKASTRSDLNMSTDRQKLKSLRMRAEEWQTIPRSHAEEKLALVALMEETVRECAIIARGVEKSCSGQGTWAAEEAERRILALLDV
jgi:hypothetical protein